MKKYKVKFSYGEGSEKVVLAEDEESAIEMAIDQWNNYYIPPGGGWCGMYKYITAKEIIEAI